MSITGELYEGQLWELGDLLIPILKATDAGQELMIKPEFKALFGHQLGAMQDPYYGVQDWLIDGRWRRGISSR